MAADTSPTKSSITPVSLYVYHLNEETQFFTVRACLITFNW